MDLPKMLSGDDLVAKGVTRIDATLPEIGMKDVIPNGSWLEQKQIQAALEARRHMVEVERIEKCGTLSHAEWQEDLMLAEVTQQAGGYWQYLGHHVGKKLYLKPEEALFLMEVNCLLLKHNEVTVSLQKAYSLLLASTISLIQYKVYASLSRLGYKVHRHKAIKLESKIDDILITNENANPVSDTEIENIGNQIIETNSTININENSNKVIKQENNTNGENIGKKEIMEKNEISNKNETGIETTINMEIEETTADSNINFTLCNEENDSENKGIKKVIKEDMYKKRDNKTEQEDLSNNRDNAVSMETEATSIKKYINIYIQENNESKGHFTDEKEDLSNSDNKTMEKEDYSHKDNIIQREDPEIEDKRTQILEDSHNCCETNKQESKNRLHTDTGTLVESDINVSTEDNELNPTIEINHRNSDILYSGTCYNEEDKDCQQRQTELSKNDRISEEKETTKLSNPSNDPKSSWNNDAIKIQKLKNRKLKHVDARILHKNFENIPELFQKNIVTVNVPKEQYIPKNIFVNNTAYVLNLEAIKTKSASTTTVDSTAFSTDEVNESHIRRLRSSSRCETPHNSQFSPFFSHVRFTNPNTQFRPFHFWRPRTNLNYINFNMLFQRSFSQTHFMPRFQFHPRTSSFCRQFPSSFNSNNDPSNFNSNNSCTINTPSDTRKRTRDAKLYNLQAIKTLTARLKQLVISGITQVQNIQSLQRLILTYNAKYKCRLRLTEDFDIVDDATIVDTIELEDEEPRSKRPRLEEDTFKENLNKLRQLALRLKDLDAKDISFSRHRRAFSNAIKTFNKSFNADVYLNINYEVIDRRHITLDSDSDSDCVMKENQSNQKKKKLRNPFNILKRLSEKQIVERPSTSRVDEQEVTLTDKIEEYKHDSTQNTFDKNWLPNEDDFGRKEVVSKHLMHSRLMDTYRDDFVYEFFDNYPQKYDNWLDLKIAFLKYIEETNKALQNEQISIQNKLSGIESELSPLIGPEDCTDMPSVLKKLRVISTNNEVNTETNLHVDFDVYNRDVPNFKKSNLPKPHFRVVCVHESSSFPSAADITALHSCYDDGVGIVFAIVGVGSISYLQINPSDLPVYAPGSDMS